MDAEDKRLAEAVLRHLLLGADADGIRFGPVLQLLVTDHRSANPPRVRLKGQTDISLVSGWVVFPGWPSRTDWFGFSRARRSVAS
jgi:hypothetical protein